MREAHVDPAILVELREVLRRRDHDRGPWPPERRTADVDHPDVRTLRREPPEVADRLLVVEQLSIRSDRESEHRFRRRNRCALP
jgi:hypothetical protein